MKLFAGTASQKLAKEIVSSLNIPLAQAEVVRFDNSEVKVTIQEDVKDHDCIVLQSTSKPTDTHLMELLFFADALKRQEARRVHALIPYFGYARQNAQHRPGECVSMGVVIKMLESAGVDEITVCTLHEEASSGMFAVPFKNLQCLLVLTKQVNEYIQQKYPDSAIAIVTPDQEGVERAREFGNALLPHTPFEVAVVEKKRNLDVKHESADINLYGDVTGRVCVIVDDIITSGGTIVHAADLCRQKGARAVITVVTHADFGPKAPEYLEQSSVEKYFVTNSIELTAHEHFPKLEVVSIAPLLASLFANA